MTNKSNPAVILGLALALVSVATSNPLLTLAGGLTLSAIWWGAFNNAISSVVACMLSVQWLQASSKIWLANLIGISLAEPTSRWITDASMFMVIPQTTPAIYLGLAAITALSVGARVFISGVTLSGSDFARFAPGRLVLIYLPLLLVSQVAGPYFGGGLAQLISAIGALRLAPIVLLIGYWFYTKRGGIALAAVFGAEILIGFLSFFSDWKTVLALAGITLISLARHAWRRSSPLLIGTFVSLLLLGTVWTIIKPHYREILNAGTGQQVILISPDEQAAALSDAILSIKPQDLSDGFLDLLSRVSYVDFLAEVLRSVPSRIEHQGGGLWGEAFQNVLTPRLLFPDKPPLPSDSVRTMQFTGRRLASDSSGTSISIGYVGESYIDFGAFGAIITSFFMGLAYGVGVLGLVYLSRSGGPALGLALTISFLWPVQQFEMSNVKLVGALGWGWAGSALFALILWPRLEPFVLTPTGIGPVALPSRSLRSRRES